MNLEEVFNRAEDAYILGDAEINDFIRAVALSVLEEAEAAVIAHAFKDFSEYGKVPLGTNAWEPLRKRIEALGND